MPRPHLATWWDIYIHTYIYHMYSWLYLYILYYIFKKHIYNRHDIHNRSYIYDLFKGVDVHMRVKVCHTLHRPGWLLLGHLRCLFGRHALAGACSTHRWKIEFIFVRPSLLFSHQLHGQRALTSACSRPHQVLSWSPAQANTSSEIKSVLVQHPPKKHCSLGILPSLQRNFQKSSRNHWSHCGYFRGAAAFAWVWPSSVRAARPCLAVPPPPPSSPVSPHGEPSTPGSSSRSS